MSSVITAYFEFATPWAANFALNLIPSLRTENSAFSLVWNWKHNCSNRCIEIEFFDPSYAKYRHPVDFPYPKDINEVAIALGAERVSLENVVVWPLWQSESLTAVLFLKNLFIFTNQL